MRRRFFDRVDAALVGRMFDRESLEREIERESRRRRGTLALLLAAGVTWVMRALRSQGEVDRGWVLATFLVSILLVMVQGSTAQLRLLLFARRLGSEPSEGRKGLAPPAE